MKYLFILSLTVLMGCSQDPKVEIIKEHEETIFGVQTDMSFKMKNLEFIREITGRDSMKIIHESIFTKDTFDINKNYIDTFYNNYSATYEKYQQAYDYYDSMINNIVNNRSFDTRVIHYFEARNDSKSGKDREAKNKKEWSIKKEKFDHYLNLRDSTIGRLYEATYTIKNPLLNNVKQTITKQFLFSPDELEIVSTIPIEESKFSK